MPHLLQATLTVGASEHVFVGNPVENQSLFRLTTEEDENGAVVAGVSHKLHQRVRCRRRRGGASSDRPQRPAPGHSRC